MTVAAFTPKAAAVPAREKSWSGIESGLVEIRLNSLAQVDQLRPPPSNVVSDPLRALHP
ncbi:hypothetical protein MKK58_07995 [Methylobacterium sp. J-078]|uniref:hypothetical protein n=1 Tax=Methylobacterium sp. J-078 TaxID=2836657 RepID=UPI001FB8D004|nr:hypothetical protein [Methylobacterium sp. J-078]MCJ2044473.1 hypothetical protein [Methylobacterium sp. J-078]